MNHVTAETHANELIARTRRAFNEIIARAEKMFNVSLDTILVLKDLGTHAGLAYGTHRVVLNVNLLISDTDTILGNTLPHEVAHVVHDKLCGLGRCNDKRAHGHAWKTICLRLGGNGKRCHDMEVKLKRKTRFYLYRYPNGVEAWLGSTRHRRLQRGENRYRLNGHQWLTADMYTGESKIRETTKDCRE